MCKFASFVLTKDREFWSEKGDSHSDIISEHNLHEWGARGPNIVKVEISPTDKIKVWPSLKAWKFVIDQDTLPDWFDAAQAEKRTRAALLRRFEGGFKTIDASGCTAMTTIEAPEATYIDARGCTAMTTIEAPKAQTIDAIGCTAMTTIEAPKATYIYARGCTAMTSIEAPKAQTIYAIGCTAMTSIEAPEATYIGASGCTAMTSIEAPKAQTIDARGCTAKLIIKAKKGATIYR